MIRRWIGVWALLTAVAMVLVPDPVVGELAHTIAGREAQLRFWMEDSVGQRLTDADSGHVWAALSQVGDTAGSTINLTYSSDDTSWIMLCPDTTDIYKFWYASSLHAYTLIDSQMVLGKYPAKGSLYAAAFSSACVPESALVESTICPRHMRSDSSYTLILGDSSTVPLSALPASMLNESEYGAWFTALLQDSLPDWLADSLYTASFDAMTCSSATVDTIAPLSGTVTIFTAAQLDSVVLPSDAVSGTGLAVSGGKIALDLTPGSGFADLEEGADYLAVKLDSTTLGHSASGINLNTGTTPSDNNKLLGYDATVGQANVVWRAMSGDVSFSGSGTADMVTAFAVDSLEWDHLHTGEVGPQDEDVLTFEETSAVFEWHTAEEAAANSSSLSPAASMWTNAGSLAALIDPAEFEAWTEECLVTIAAANGWTSTKSDGGAAAPTFGASAGAWELDPSDGTIGDNDEVYAYTVNGVAVKADARTIYAEARIYVDEQNTDDANYLFGFIDTPAANILQDNGAGPPASYDGAVIFKVDGGTVWQAEVSDGLAQTTDTDIGNVANTAWVRLGIKINGTTNAMFYIDGALAGTLATNLPDAALKIIFGVKNGDTNMEYLYIDWVKFGQIR